MSNDDDMLAEFDLSAWEAPPPPADLADAVVDRMGGTDVGISVPVDEHAVARRGWIIAGAAVAAIVLAIGVWSLIRATHHAAPASGGVIADKPRTLSLDTVHATLDPGAEVRWHRDGNVLRVEQRAGTVMWHVDDGEQLTIDAGATSASVEATGANLRVEVQMNATDARVLGGVALTAAAVAMVTVVVYEGHVKVGKPNQQTIVVAPGTTYKVNAVDDTAPVVGSAPIGTGKLAILGLESIGDSTTDAQVVARSLSTWMRTVAADEGPYRLAPASERELVDEKLMFNCTSEAPDCMAAIGGGIGADVLVFGRLEHINNVYTVTAKLFDVAHKQVKRTTVMSFALDDDDEDKLGDHARKVVLDLFGTAATACDANALKEQGMEKINLGLHAEALDKFEQSLACKQDPYVVQLAFMESCASASSPKARQYYKQLTPAQQGKFAQMCERTNTEYLDDVSDACASVDEVACVLNNYEGICCQKYRRPPKQIDSLTRGDIVVGIGKVKAKVLQCGEQSANGGKITARIEVKPDGSVKSVEIKSADPALTSCVTPILESATFIPRKNGGTFSYPFMIAGKAVATCDAAALKEQGMENINLGQHAAALAKFELSLKCKSDPFVTQLAFMEACSSMNAPKAKLYFARMTPAQQAKFAQLCIRQKVEYR